jgi:hypothetical protein
MVLAGALAAALAPWLAPDRAQAAPHGVPGMAAAVEPVACNTPRQRRLLPNGKFEDTGPQDCYPDLHSAPMSNAPPGMGNPAGTRCRNVPERVLQPNGRFQTRLTERCT